MAYNPDLHTVSNKPYGTAQAEPVDARAYFYDNALFKYRAYQSTAEVISYLNAPQYRTGQFSIIINLTGTLQLDGTFSDTHITEWWFKNGVLDEHLIPKCSDCFNDSNLTRFGIEDDQGLQNRAVDMQDFDFIINDIANGLFSAGDFTQAGAESNLTLTDAISLIHSQIDSNTYSNISVSGTQALTISQDGSTFQSISVTPTNITLDDNTNSWNNSNPTMFLTTDASGNLVLSPVVNGGNRVEPLQETCDVGHTTTTSIIIGSSDTSHSGVAGQLVVGTASTASGAATNGVALNNSSVTGVNATGANSATASGSGSFAGGTSTASGPNSVAFGVTGNASGSGATKLGSGCTASGDNSVATGASTTASGVASLSAGTGNTASGLNSAAFGSLNTVTGRQCMAVGTQNTSADSGTNGGNSRGNSLAVGWLNSVTRANSVAIGRSNSVQGGDSCVSLGVSNIQTGYEYQTGMPAGAMQGVAAVAIGGVNTTTGDFSIAIGYANTSNGKAAVALGWRGKTVCPGEVVISQGGLTSNNAGNYLGQNQTSFLHFRRWDINTDPAASTTRLLYSYADENVQLDGTPSIGFETVWGKTWYPLETLNVYYITGKFTGITSTGDICVWTIDTYIKNVAGTITVGTANFTNVLRDAAFATMNTVTLDTSLTDTGTTKKLHIAYNNTGVAYPIAKYSCLMTITKLGW